MEKVTLQVTFPKEKLDALRFYMNEKQLTVEEELQKHIKNTYDKYVPSATRRYLDRNDNSEEIAAVTNENTSETRNTTTRGRRRAGRSQSAGEQETAETINEVEIEETSDQTEEQNQGMTMSM